VAIVADTRPLILFARAGHLHLLDELFGEVIVPPRVAAEAYLDEPSRPGAAALAAAGTWLRIEAPPVGRSPNSPRRSMRARRRP
jgi:predicted nucleic acid-binding protein